MAKWSPPEATGLGKLLIFGGTVEGRELAEFAAAAGVETLLSVVSSYGAELIHPDPRLHLHQGRMDSLTMAALFAEFHPDLIIDATHPHAYEVSQNIRQAASELKLPLIRCVRERTELPGVHYFDRLEDALAYLSEKSGVIFSALGLKSAPLLATLPTFQERIVLRVLPDSQGLRTLEDLGFPRKHIIAMQGPFSESLNRAMFEATEAKFLLSKDSGNSGGTCEKTHAAESLGMEICLLRMPQEAGLSETEIKAIIQEYQDAKN